MAPVADRSRRPGVRALVLAAAGLLLAAAARAEPLGAERHLLELLNAERVRSGLPPLSWEDQLAGLAREHVDEMRDRGVASHYSRDGSGFAERLDRTSLPILQFAENVALAGTLFEAHLGLMRSDRHRANILDPELTHVGLGVATTADGLATFVVQDFTRQLPSFDAPQAREAVRGALDALPREGPGLPLREVDALSAEAERLSGEMARREMARAPGLPAVDHDVAFFYSSLDPRQLPESVSEVAPFALDYGLGVTARRAADGTGRVYWVVVVFRDIL
jgi:hypothetical protein